MKDIKSAKLSPIVKFTAGLMTLFLAAVLPTATAASGDGGIDAALKQASKEGKFLFAFVYEKADQPTQALRQKFETTLGKLGDNVTSYALDRTDAKEKTFVTQRGLAAAPMPLVLVLAPNGAVTGGMRAGDVTESKLRDTLASPGLQKCLKALQQGHLVLVCLQNNRTEANEAAMKGVNDFKSNSQFGRVTEVVSVNPADAKELKFLAQLQADPKAEMACTVMLAPPGAMVAKVQGPTSSAALTAALQKAMSSCAPGSGCCPAPAQK